MNSTTTWLAELLYALKTLPRNPYLQARLAKICRIMRQKEQREQDIRNKIL